MPQPVPLQALPNQTLQVVLNNQSTILNVYQSDYGLFMDVYLSDQLIVGGVLALNRNKIIRGTIAAIGTPGYSGDFAFDDLQGDTDPVFTGLGSRYVLFYYSADELA